MRLGRVLDAFTPLLIADHLWLDHCGLMHFAELTNQFEHNNFIYTKTYVSMPFPLNSPSQISPVDEIRPGHAVIVLHTVTLHYFKGFVM